MSVMKGQILKIFKNNHIFIEKVRDKKLDVFEVINSNSFDKVANEIITAFSESTIEAETSKENLNIADVTKRTFNFDYCGKAYLDSKNNWITDIITESVEAWDDEHATLLFKEMHPNTEFDPPY